MKVAALALALAALAACGGPGNALSGDARFPIAAAHALRTDAGKDVGEIVEIYLSEEPATCASLRDFENALQSGPVAAPFANAIYVAYIDLGNSNYPIASDARTPSITDSVALWFEPDGGALAVSGFVTSSESTDAHASGQFHTQAMQLADYFAFENGGTIDATGHPRWSDGGAAPSLLLAGSYDVDVCK